MIRGIFAQWQLPVLRTTAQSMVKVKKWTVRNLTMNTNTTLVYIGVSFLCTMRNKVTLHVR